MSKLTDAQWAEALALYATGQWTGRQLGKRYGISGVAMSRRLRVHKASVEEAQ